MARPIKDDFKAGAPITSVPAGWFNRIGRILNGLLIQGGQLLRDPEDRAWTIVVDNTPGVPVKCTAVDEKDGEEETGYHTFKVCNVDGVIAEDATEYINCRIWGDFDKDISVTTGGGGIRATFGFLYTMNGENVVALSGNIATVID